MWAWAFLPLSESKLNLGFLSPQFYNLWESNQLSMISGNPWRLTSSWLSAFSSWDCTSSFIFCVLSAHVENVVSWLVSMKNPRTALIGWVFFKFFMHYFSSLSPLLSFSGFYLTSSLIRPKSFIFFFLLVCRANQFTQAPVCKPVHANSTFCSVDEKGFICIRIHPAWIIAGDLSTTYFVLLRIYWSKQLCACVYVCIYTYTALYIFRKAHIEKYRLSFYSISY